MDRSDNNVVVGVGGGNSGGGGGGGSGGGGVGCHVGNSGSPPNSTSSIHGTVVHNSTGGGFDGQVYSAKKKRSFGSITRKKIIRYIRVIKIQIHIRGRERIFLGRDPFSSRNLLHRCGQNNNIIFKQ